MFEFDDVNSWAVPKKNRRVRFPVTLQVILGGIAGLVIGHFVLLKMGIDILHQ